MNDVASLPAMAGRKKDTTSDPTMGVPPEVYAAFSAWCKRNSFIRRDIAGKLLTWFMEQHDDALRKVVIGGTSLGLEDAYARAIEDLAKRVRAGKINRVGVRTGAHAKPLPELPSEAPRK